MHKESILKLTARAKGVGIDALLSAQVCNDQKHHWSTFMKLLFSIQFLSRQGLPFRGHKEDIQAFGGNLYQLLLLQAKDNPQMISWLKRKEYISPEIVNEIIRDSVFYAKILAEVRTALWFTIIIDEATDISHNEQCHCQLGG